MLKTRTSGVLLSLGSLPGTLGIGDLGNDAYRFVDELKNSNTKLWQILPLNPVGYGNSPYQTYSAFAGDEIYISIEKLYEYLKLELDFEKVVSSSINYDQVRSTKQAYLKTAFDHFQVNEDYKSFLKDAFWLEEYVQFISLKKKNDLKSWLEWEETEISTQDLEYERFIQFIFFKQWMDLKQYANNKGILIVGDIPIYLGHDSAEVYFKQEQFHLDNDGRPTLVAGVPPDFFSTEGQLWGNPLYDWDTMKEDNYEFWIERMKWNQISYDVIRIDHFRAFDTYWAIPGYSDTARKGEWHIGPRNDLFDALYEAIPNLQLVVEDLGDLRPEVLELRDDYDLMGMKIVEFALNAWDLEKDHLLDKNLLAYTGTHDNQTIVGWLEDLGEAGAKDLENNLLKMGYDDEELFEKINHYTLGLPCNWAILPMQDIIGLDNEARINTPSTIGSPNWEWKLETFDQMIKPMQTFKNIIKKTNR